MKDERNLFETGLERQSARERLSELLGNDVVKQLHRRSDYMGWYAVLTCWIALIALLLMTASAVNLLGWVGLPFIVLGVLLIGGRILALAILTHEGAHRTLFANAQLNDTVTHWLCAAPVYLDLIKYCSGSMIPDTQIGGNLIIKEVFNDKKTTSIIHSGVQA